MKDVRAMRGGRGDAMRGRSVSRIPFVLLGVTALGMGCQLLYDKNDLTVSTGGAGGTTVSTNGGIGGTTSTTGGGGTTSSGGSTGGSTSSGGSTGGTTTGGTGGTTTTGGTGGTTTTGGTGGTTTTGGTGGITGSGGDMDGGMGGADGGDCSSDRLFVLGASTSNILCGTYSPMGGWAVATDATASSNERPAAQLVSASTGAGVIFTAPGPVRSVTLANGVCAASASLQGFSSKAPPSAAALGGKVHALVQGAVDMGTDHPFHTIWDPAQGTWSMPVQINANVFSPVSAGLASSGVGLLAVYGGKDNPTPFLYRVAYENGAWVLPALCFWVDPMVMAAGCEPVDNTVSPSVTFMDNGSWLVVYKDSASTSLKWLTYTGMTQKKPEKITNALTTSSPSLARVTGGAVLAFRGTDNGVYAVTFDYATATWGSIAHVGLTATTSAPPAVAAGVCAHTAEIVYVDAADSGKLKHASLDAGTWTTPAPVGSAASMKGVALSSSK